MKTKQRRLLCNVDYTSDHGELKRDGDRSSAKSPKITGAELRVLTLVARAKSNKEIAADLGLSPATVKRHMEKILKKLKLRNRVEAAIFGLMLNGCPNVPTSECVIRKLQTVGDPASAGPIDP
jgi:DNA-binding NarL/FixJ family response regulator